MDTFNAQISDLGRPAQRVLTGVNFEENRIRLEGQKPFDKYTRLSLIHI